MTKLKQKKGVSKVITLALVLLLPGFLAIMMNRFGSNSYSTLPVFGEKFLSGEVIKKMGKEIPDTVYHTLQSISFSDMDGEDITLLSDDTSIYVLNLFYTKDKSFSKHNTDQMEGLAERFGYNSKVNLFSISVDPNDTSERLKEFMKQYLPLKSKHWFVVTNPSRDIFKFAQEEMLIDAHQNPEDSSHFYIDNTFLLVDSRHRIRGVYSGDQQSEAKRLEDEIKLLLVEEVRNRPLTVIKN